MYSYSEGYTYEKCRKEALEDFENEDEGELSDNTISAWWFFIRVLAIFLGMGIVVR